MEEMDMILFCRQLKFLPTKKGLVFLKKMKYELPYGHCQLVMQNGEPWRMQRAVADDLIKLPLEIART